MKLTEYLSTKGHGHGKEGNPHVRCNALYKKSGSLNCYLRPVEAIQLARNLLQKAQILVDNGIDDGAVQIWSNGANNEKLYCGLVEARKGGRKKKAATGKS